MIKQSRFDVEGTASRRSDPLGQTVRTIVALSASYQPGSIVEAERVVDTYLAAFLGYRRRRAAIDDLVGELSVPAQRAFNRGGLFEQVEMHLGRRHREIARMFH